MPINEYISLIQQLSDPIVFIVLSKQPAQVRFVVRIG